MNYDEYGEVINGEKTYERIADMLTTGKRALIGWTDGDGTHFDILFVLTAPAFGTIQGGVRETDMFVSIMRWGAFGFDICPTDTAAGYYDEKLSRSGTMGPTAEKLADLINGIKAKLF